MVSPLSYPPKVWSIFRETPFIELSPDVKVAVNPVGTSQYQVFFERSAAFDKALLRPVANFANSISSFAVRQRGLFRIC